VKNDSAKEKCNEIADFFQTLFGVEAAGYLSIWQKDTKISTHFKLPALFGGLASRILVSAERDDVYYGVGLRGRDCGGAQRGKAQDVVAIPGLWMDIDVVGSGHAKQDLPADIETALTWLDTELEHPPSLVVASGGGLHAYWLFKELWTFDSDERDRAAKTVAGWQAVLCRKAQDQG